METVLDARADFSAFAAVASGSAEPRPGVGPVTLPPYLDRSQIVMSDRANELNLAEFDQWAESLQTNFTRVLGENLVAVDPDGLSSGGQRCPLIIPRFIRSFDFLGLMEYPR